MEIFRDSIWQFVGVVVAVLALLVAAAALVLQARRKSLSVTIGNFSPLFRGSPSAIKDDIIVTYKGQEVTDVSIVMLVFANDGGQAVIADDFETPISVAFKTDAKILTAELATASPSDLVPVITHNTQSLTIAPLLLNPKDTFSVAVLLQGLQFRHPRDLFPKASARIKGVKKVNFDSPFIPIIGFETPLFGFNIDIRLVAVIIIATSVSYLIRFIS